MKKTIILTIIIAGILLLNTCSSPLEEMDGTGEIVFTLGTSSTARALYGVTPGAEEYLSFAHTLTLYGKDGTVGPLQLQYDAAAKVLRSSRVKAGAYNRIVIHAWGANPYDPSSSPQLFQKPSPMVRAFGELLDFDFEISSGKTTVIDLQGDPFLMYSFVAVESWDELIEAVSFTPSPPSNYSSLPEIIFVDAKSIIANSTVTINREIIVMGADATINRGSFTDSFFSVSGPKGILGLQATVDGSLTLDGGGTGVREPLIQVANGGELYIKNNIGPNKVILQRNNVVDPVSPLNGGGAVYVNSGHFYMLGGTIKDNKVTADTSTQANGGGVFIDNGYFQMDGGSIEKNQAIYNNISVGGPIKGGGVYVDGGIFTMSGGRIDNNMAIYNTSTSGGQVYGGGVCLENAGILNMAGDSISGNSVVIGSSATMGASLMGGGVYIGNSGTFNMSGEATIARNGVENLASITFLSSDGGGVYVAFSGSFNMSGGEIKGNTCLNNTSQGYGAGVYLVDASSGYFSKSGGTIYGVDMLKLYYNDESNIILDTSLNVAWGKNGHAAYGVSPSVSRDKTIGPDQESNNLPNFWLDSAW